ncbi:MAG: DNA gyrase inhibitor YacG [Porticoccus sp.]|nr:MAG: DNA gyrase inhibitor YacG [Porticoccus sp.]
MNESKALTVNCPTCKKSVTWGEDSPYRPFCGKRCQQLDFGAWASEQFSIPGNETMPPDDADSDAENGGVTRH